MGLHGGCNELRPKDQKPGENRSKTEIEEQGVEKIARLKQQPHREHGSEESIDEENAVPAVDG
jgi:hypothetical protein